MIRLSFFPLHELILGHKGLLTRFEEGCQFDSIIFYCVGVFWQLQRLAMTISGTNKRKIHRNDLRLDTNFSLKEFSIFDHENLGP
jgi:hypothetical protein